MGLALTLIPMIPGLVQGIISIIDAIQGHQDTPDEARVKLEAISNDLKAINVRVQAVRLPNVV